MRFAAHPLVEEAVTLRARVWENHIYILMKLGGMIQYGRADLDLAAYDVKYFGTQLDVGHFIVQKSENNFPARAVK